MKTTSRNVQLFGAGVETDPLQPGGALFYDGDCSLCLGTVHHLRPLLNRYGIRPIPIQTPWVNHLLLARGLDPDLEIRLLRRDGKLFGGADALLEIARGIWWARPLAFCIRALHLAPLLRLAYKQIAKHRRCLNGVCKLHHAHP